MFVVVITIMHKVFPESTYTFGPFDADAAEVFADAAITRLHLREDIYDCGARVEDILSHSLADIDKLEAPKQG